MKQVKEIMVKSALLLFFFGGITSAVFAQSVHPKYTLKGDSIISPISLQYSDPSFIRRILLGTNYRKTWETPVSFPVFHMNELGFKVKELGGGMQTKSLRLEDKKGEEWVLRSLEKDVSKAVPSIVQNTIGQSIAQDMISGSHPYAPLTVFELAKAVGVVSAQPTYYYVPDDPAFGEFRAVFANTVCMLEEREPTWDNTETVNTEKLLEELLEGKNHVLFQEGLLKARLLDMLIGDWDRHADQWRWGKKDSNNVTYYYAIPRDRDQAYFESTGLLVRTAKFFILPFLSEFKPRASSFKALNTKAWSFDALLLNSLSKKDWIRITQTFQQNLTDEVIHKAVATMPSAIYALDGQKIESVLKIRRDELLKGSMKYYDFQARYVSIVGSKDEELFDITGDKDSLTITVYNLEDKYKNLVLYKRTFLPEETSKIKLMSLDGKDKFVMSENAAARIKLTIDGGKGENSFDLKGKVKYKIYESENSAKIFEDVLKTYLRIGIRFI
ncbi:MAG TPA: hypothetical protein VM888_00380 [Chitinophagaceae bacterium]|nr:hypothetical protein [Chitinophagaceae bacterium]